MPRFCLARDLLLFVFVGDQDIRSTLLYIIIIRGHP